MAGSKVKVKVTDRKSPLKGSRPSVPHGTNFNARIYIKLKRLRIVLSIHLPVTIQDVFKTVSKVSLELFPVISDFNINASNSILETRPVSGTQSISCICLPAKYMR